MAEELVVPESLAGERLDRAVALLTGWTRREVQDLVEAGAVLVDGARVAKSRKLEAGERDRGARRRPRRAGLPEPDPTIEVVVRYEDADVIVVAKPAGLVVHPGAGHPDGTLVNGLLARYPEIAAVGDPARPGHRAPARPRHQRAARGGALDARVRGAGRDARRPRRGASLRRAGVGHPRRRPAA